MARSIEIKDAFLRCRTRRHQWDEIPDDGGIMRKYKESNTVGRMAERCLRCGSVKYTATSKITGAPLFYEIRYPKDYLQETGEHISQREFKVEFFSRRDTTKKRVSKVA